MSIFWHAEWLKNVEKCLAWDIHAMLSPASSLRLNPQGAPQPSPAHLIPCHSTLTPLGPRACGAGLGPAALACGRSEIRRLLPWKPALGKSCLFSVASFHVCLQQDLFSHQVWGRAAVCRLASICHPTTDPSLITQTPIQALTLWP